MYQWPDLHLLLVVRCLSNLPCPLRRSVICGRSVAEGIFICNGYGINGNRGVNFLSRLRKRTRDQQINVLQSTSLQKIIRAIRHKIGTKIILLNGACYLPSSRKPGHLAPCMRPSILCQFAIIIIPHANLTDAPTPTSMRYVLTHARRIFPRPDLKVHAVCPRPSVHSVAEAPLSVRMTL